MDKLTQDDVIKSLRQLPDEQKMYLAAAANVKGISIEKEVVPVITNMANVCVEVANIMVENYKFLLGENYKYLSK